MQTAHFISLLMGKALTWAIPIWNKGGEQISSYDSFLQLFHCVFDHLLEGPEIGERLLTLKQSNLSTMEFTLNFHTLAMDSGWNELAVKVAYCQGINTDILMQSHTCGAPKCHKERLCYHCGILKHQVAQCSPRPPAKAP